LRVVPILWWPIYAFYIETFEIKLMRPICRY
jgi:hypothetical protein